VLGFAGQKSDAKKAFNGKPNAATRRIAYQRKESDMPGSGTTRKSLYSTVTTILLAVCLVYIGVDWLLAPCRPQLTEVVLRVPISNDASIYGVKDDRGGATVPFSYRYYVYRNLAADSEILSALEDAGPFLVTRDASAKVNVQGRSITVSVSGAVSDYHSNTVYRHANGSDYTAVSVFLNSRPEG
jgi:hypothetical protein